MPPRIPYLPQQVYYYDRPYQPMPASAVPAYRLKRAGSDKRFEQVYSRIEQSLIGFETEYSDLRATKLNSLTDYPSVPQFDSPKE